MKNLTVEKLVMRAFIRRKKLPLAHLQRSEPDLMRTK